MAKPTFPVGRRALLIAAAAALAGCATRGPLPEGSEEIPDDLVERLRAGGHVIYFRHGATDRNGTDGPSMPRAEQRLLSEEGIAQSRRIGRRFRALGIPVGPVLTSPMYRCLEMGQIAFDKATVDPQLLNAANDLFDLEGVTAHLRGLLSAPVAPGENRILISHKPNLLRVAGLSLAPAEAAVFRPVAGPSFQLVARVLAEEW